MISRQHGISILHMISSSLSFGSFEKRTLLQHVLIEFFAHKDIRNVSFLDERFSKNMSSDLSESFVQKKIMFIEDLGVEDDGGDEKAVNKIFIPSNSRVFIINFADGRLFSMSQEIKTFHHYFSLAEKDESQAHLLAMFLAIELFHSPSKKKISEISMFLKKIKSILRDGEFEYSWDEVSISYLSFLALVSFELGLDEISLIQNHRVRELVLDIFNRSGGVSEVIKKAEEFINNPTAECAEKARAKSGINTQPARFRHPTPPLPETSPYSSSPIAFFWRFLEKLFPYS